MELSNYISDLLYRHDCVIVPNFGGFITNKTGAKINNLTHTFYPPSKQISFNVHLKHNDGLLVNYMAFSEKISFEDALAKIDTAVSEWKRLLQSKPIEIRSIGSFFLNLDKQLIFSPFSVNYLTESFGTSTVKCTEIKRPKNETKILPINTKSPKNKNVPIFIKYASTVAILLIFATIFLNKTQIGQTTISHNKDSILKDKDKQSAPNQAKPLEEKVQESGFTIDSSLLTTNLVKKPPKIEKNYYIIAGAFKFDKNAEEKVKQLREKGFESQNIGKNKWGLTQVTFGSFKDNKQALKFLNNIRKTVSKDAWLLVKEREK